MSSVGSSSRSTAIAQDRPRTSHVRLPSNLFPEGATLRRRDASCDVGGGRLLLAPGRVGGRTTVRIGTHQRCQLVGHRLRADPVGVDLSEAAIAGARSASSSTIRRRGSGPDSRGRSLCDGSPARRSKIASGLATRQKIRPLRLRLVTLSGSSIMRPPVEMTSRRRSASSEATSRSMVRKASSPLSRKMSATLPWRCSITWSVSTNSYPSCSASRRPTVVLPVPMKPVSTTLRGSEAVIVDTSG